MTRPSTAERKPRRWFAPRFSLGMLMLAVTAAAVGAAFWWRWPVTTVSTIQKGNLVFQETYTYHRGLGGELIKHGIHRTTVNGEVEFEEFYREGVRHGPYRELAPSSWNTREVIGEYFAGKKHGTWHYTPDSIARIGKGWESPLTVVWPAPERYQAEEHWNHRRRDGLFQCWDQAGKLCFRYEFKDDRLNVSQANHSSCLLRRIADGQLTDVEVQHAIVKRCDLFYHDRPLHAVILPTSKMSRLASRTKRQGIPARRDLPFPWFPSVSSSDLPSQKSLKNIAKLLTCESRLRRIWRVPKSLFFP